MLKYLHFVKQWTTVGLLALSGMSCAQPRERCEVYHFHKSFPQAYYGPAIDAAAKWSAFSNHKVTVDPNGDPEEQSCAFRAIDSDSQEYQNLKAEMSSDFEAAHEYNNGAIVFAEKMWEMNGYCTDDRQACAKSILMHEIAHEYGLAHVEDPAAIMGVTNPESRLNYNVSDRIECERVGACR